MTPRPAGRRRGGVHAALAALALASLGPSALGAAGSLGAGKLLVAKRNLWDPNFSQTVVLLIEHGPQGALGVIVNRPTEMRLSLLLPEIEDLEERTDTLHFGGPVARGHILVLLRAEGEPEEARHVFADVYASASRELLEGLLGRGEPADRVRVFAGHAGWAPGQLEAEVARDDWLVLQADPETVFAPEPAEVWPRLIQRETDLLAEERPRPPSTDRALSKGYSSRSARAGDERDILYAG